MKTEDVPQTAAEVIAEIIGPSAPDLATALGAAGAIIEFLAERGWSVVYLRKAHTMSHFVCDCGCGTVVVTMEDEVGKAFAAAQLDPPMMAKFAETLLDQSREAMRH